MRWLFSRLLAITVILILSIGATLIVGQSQSISPRVAMLHLRDCQLPCWIGIVPGKTTIGEALKLVKQVYSDLPIENEQSYLLIGDLGLQLRVAFNENGYDYAKDAIVEYISLFEYENNTDVTDFPVGQIYTLLGSPDYIAQWGSEGTAFPMLQYTKYGSILSFGTVSNANDPILPCTRPDPQWLFLGLESYQDVPTTSFQAQPWRGFGRCYTLGIREP